MSIRIQGAIYIVLLLVLASCGQEAEPTLSSADISNTAIANAWTELASTQAALPTSTATPVPPTLTPPPTFTRFPTITPGGALATTSVPSGPATENPCYLPFPPYPQGGQVTVTFINQSGGMVSLSYGMMDVNSFGECGAGGGNLGMFDELSVKVLAGCYWAYGYVSGPDTSTAQIINPLCMTSAGTDYEVTIGTEVIEFK